LSAQKLLARVLQVVGVVLCGLILVFGSYVLGAYITGRSNSPIGPGGPFHLEDQNGKPVSDQDMKGRPFVVFFGYTHCPDICPKSLGRDADRAGALFITVDPERDTSATLKDYLSNFDPHLRGLTGDPAAVDAALKSYRVYAKKIPIKDGDYTMDHTAVVYLMDKDGQFVALFDLQQTPVAAADQLRGFL
jgi:protein SCO1